MAERTDEERDHYREKVLATEQERRKPTEWAKKRGVRVYNYALLDRVSDSEFEDRIGRAIEDAYWQGVARGRETLEEQLGA